MPAIITRTPAQRPAAVVDTSGSPFSRLRPLGLGAVRLEDRFWAPRRHTIRTVTLPSQYALLEDTGRLDNFRRAAGLVQREYQGREFNDSDVYKWLEGAAWMLATDPDPDLQGRVDEVVRLIAAAQDESGYLDTYFAGDRAAERWTDLKWAHELYCAGHLMQAAVAHHRAMGTRDLLDVAVRLAGHIGDTFGPHARSGACGHPEIEMALVELARETNDPRYLRQAELFIDQRGQRPPVISGEAYAQDHAPFRDQHAVVGHAVRALYLYCGATDVYAETGDQGLWAALTALWRDLHESKVYITGGVGARYEGESVGEDYELPNRRAYAETCAAIAHAMWSWRMLLVTGEARFADALETALYNGVLVGLSLGGQTYSYENPLADRGAHRRQPWFSCACCPPNLARLLAALPGYLYSVSDEGLWVHLFASGTATATLPNGDDVTVTQRTEYPWDGEIGLELRLSSPASFSLMVRVPAWCREAAVHVNGEPLSLSVQPGSYTTIRRRWETGDLVCLSLAMPVRLLASHPFVLDNHGRAAVTRGPLVYCIEQADHPDTDVWDLHLQEDAAWSTRFEPELLGGVVSLHAEGRARPADAHPRELYFSYRTERGAQSSVPLTAVPYYAWGNREAGPMQVWIPAAQTVTTSLPAAFVPPP